MADIFISYHYADRNFANRLYQELRRFNVRGFLDHTDVAAGADFSRQLRDAISNADAIVVVLSRAAAQSSFVLAELGMAQGLAKPILPVLAPGESYEAAVPPQLLDRLVIDASTSPIEEVAAKVVAAVTNTSVDRALQQVRSGALRRQRRLALIAFALGLSAVISLLLAGVATFQRNDALVALADARRAQQENEAALRKLESAQRALSEVQARAASGVEMARESCALTDRSCQRVADVAAAVQALAASASSSIEGVIAPSPPPQAGVVPSSTAELREMLNGEDRRRVSDAMVAAYTSDPATAQQVIGSLAAASLPERERSAYRVNLYILRTLAKLPNGWSASNELDRNALIAIAKSPELRKDQTYERWAEQALSNEKR